MGACCVLMLALAAWCKQVADTCMAAHATMQGSLNRVQSKLGGHRRRRLHGQLKCTLHTMLTLAWLTGSVQLCLAHSHQPTLEQLRIAKHARNLRIYIYDLAGAALMPSPTAFAANSTLCSTPHCRNRLFGTDIDLCNDAFGRPTGVPFAAAYQVRLCST
jgi:hypothetical protein